MDSLRKLTAVTYQTSAFAPWRAEIRLDDMPLDDWFTDCDDFETAAQAAHELHGDIIYGRDEQGNAILSDDEVVIDGGVILNIK